MRPIPIPDEIIEKARPIGWQSHVIAAPSGDLLDDKIRPVDALVGVVQYEDGEQALELNVLIELDEGEHEKLAQNGGRFWINFTGGISPFALNMYDPDDKSIIGRPPAEEQGGNNAGPET